jgi:hypothetical protein
MIAVLLSILAAALHESAGSGPKETAPFDVARPGWRIEWEGRDVRIYVLNEQNQVMFLPANEKGMSRGSAAVPLDAGRYYLRVGGASWKVKVVE